HSDRGASSKQAPLLTADHAVYFGREDLRAARAPCEELEISRLARGRRGEDRAQLGDCLDIDGSEPSGDVTHLRDRGTGGDDPRGSRIPDELTARIRGGHLKADCATHIHDRRNVSRGSRSTDCRTTGGARITSQPLQGK